MTAKDELFRELAEHYGTPTYIYDLDAVTGRVAHLRSALPESQLCYAVKANPNGAVLARLAELGLGAEVISLGELERAVRAGMPAHTILLGGPGQARRLIDRALALGVARVSLDSPSQWRLWQASDADGVAFFPRVNPGLDPRTHEHLATGAATSKFGMTPQRATELAEALQATGQLGGFHVHAGSQIRDISVYDEIFAVLTPLFERFEQARSLDIGGGFAVPGFDVAGFAAKVRRFTDRFDLELITEPGRYLVADAGVLLTRVLHVKEGQPTHLIADAGMADLLRPALYGAAHPLRVLGKTDVALKADVDGPLCENADRLGRDLELPITEPGDLLVVEQTGAYGMAMASNYASSLRPAEVVIEGGQARLVRRRETVEDLLEFERV